MVRCVSGIGRICIYLTIFHLPVQLYVRANLKAAISLVWVSHIKNLPSFLLHKAWNMSPHFWRDSACAMNLVQSKVFEGGGWRKLCKISAGKALLRGERKFVVVLARHSETQTGDFRQLCWRGRGEWVEEAINSSIFFVSKKSSVNFVVPVDP